MGFFTLALGSAVVLFPRGRHTVVPTVPSWGSPSPYKSYEGGDLALSKYYRIETRAQRFDLHRFGLERTPLSRPSWMMYNGTR